MTPPFLGYSPEKNIRSLENNVGFGTPTSMLIIGVIADFTTHGKSHFYGLPCPYADSLDPIDHFCSFDVS